MKKKIIAVLFTLFALGVIAAAFYPIANSFYQTYPPLGDDFYHTFSQVQFFRNNLNWPQLSWNYIWYFGGPTILGYPWLNYYPIVFLTNQLGLYRGTILYFLTMILLYGWVSYLLLKKLSASKILAAGLAVALVWSASTWHLMFKSAFAAATNQLFLALSLYLIVTYQASKKRKYLGLAAVVTGLSFLVHGIATPFLLPAALILLVFWWEAEERFWQWKKKIKDFFSFLLLVILTSSYYFYMLLSGFGPARYDTSVFNWMKKDAFTAIYNKTNIVLFLLTLLFFLLVLVFRKFKESKKAVPFLAVLLYIIIFNAITVTGHNPVGLDFPPHKSWFIYSLCLGCLAAVFWQAVVSFLKKHFRQWLYILIKVFVMLILFAPFGLFSLYQYLDNFKTHNEECSCAPDSAQHEAIIKDDYTKINKLFPDWFPKDDRNQRYLALNSCLYLWWNAINQMPLPTGYALILRNKNNLDHLNRIGNIYNGSLKKDNPTLDPKIIKNNALFYLDWMGVGFVEKFESPYNNDPDLVVLDKEPAAYNILPVNEKATSPIVKATRAPAVLVVSSLSGFDTVINVLMQENLNSRHLIPVQGPEYLEDIKSINLSDFDAVFLYDYRYKHEKSFNKYPSDPWDKLAAYVRNGGKLFLETGSEVKESDIKNLPVRELPEVFPVNKTAFGQLGNAWQLTSENPDFLSAVKTDNFSPLIYNDSAWKLSYALPADLRTNAQAVLRQEGKVILASYTLGQGKVYWSGLTLPYHIKTYNNWEESQLFRKILDELVGMKDEGVLSFDFSRPKSEKIELSGRDFSGVLFKENINPGWQAKVNGEKSKIYKTALGFMYTRIPAEKIKNNITVNFTYRGQPSLNFLFYLSLLTIALVSVYCFIEGKINLKKKIGLEKTKKKLTKWWEKDEEEN